MMNGLVIGFLLHIRGAGHRMTLSAYCLTRRFLGRSPANEVSQKGEETPVPCKGPSAQHWAHGKRRLEEWLQTARELDPCG